MTPPARESGGPGDAPHAAPALVAHRGDVRHHPENTIESVVAALEAGATHVEVDVHVTADGVPVLHHDADLTRLAGDPRRVEEVAVTDLAEIELRGAASTGRIPTLAALVGRLHAWPEAFVFVEIKPTALVRYGRVTTVASVVEALAPIRARSCVISFDAAAIELARASGASVGWILDRWDDETHRIAELLAPAFLFCDHEKIPPAAELWPGSWRWAVYEVVDAPLALRLAAQGADFVETMDITALQADPRLREPG